MNLRSRMGDQNWSAGECEAIPGKTMPHIQVVERDYAAVYNKMISLGPNVKDKPIGTKGIAWSATEEYEKLKGILGVNRKDGGRRCA